jgi:thiamine-monophosphate kinase
MGTTVETRVLRRSGARAGDGLYVSGQIGASATGLDLLQRGMALSPEGGLIVPDGLRAGPISMSESVIRAHIDPEPRLALGRELNRRKLATACIDVSDGLGLDLHRLCRASGVGARIEERALPIAPGVLAWERFFRRDATARAVSGGEDYELLFTGNAKKLDRFREEGEFTFTRIGEMVAGERVEIAKRDGGVETLTASGWDHFRATLPRP